MKNARNPKQVIPQPEKYLTNYWGWSNDINNAQIFSIAHAKSICKSRGILNRDDRIKPYKDGFIITKSATP